MDRKSLLQISTPAPHAMAQQPYSLASLSSVFVGMPTASGKFVNEQTAMRVSGVLTALRILSEDFAALPCHVYRRTATGSVPATDLGLYGLLHDSPNPFMTTMELWEAMVLNLYAFGFAVAEKSIGRNGLEGLFPVSSNRVQYKDTVAGVPRYTISESTGQRVVLADDLLIVRMLGMGALESQAIPLLAREAIGLLMAADEQSARLFSNGIQPGLLFQSDSDIDPEQKKQLETMLNRDYAGSANAWKAIFAENGLKVDNLSLTAQESQFIEARAFQLADIARLFRIPAVMMGLESKNSTYASAEVFAQNYVRYTLQPLVRRFETSIARDLIPTSEKAVFAKFNLDSLLRASTKDRFESYRAAIETGVMTRNEVRALEDLPALPGLDEPLTPLNMGGSPAPAEDTEDAVPSEQAHRLATALAANVVEHQAKLIAEGKKLQPDYVTRRTGLSQDTAAGYCNHGQPDAELLVRLLLGA